MITHDIVGKLWNLCNVLKDDGITYHQYVRTDLPAVPQNGQGNRH